MKTLISILFVMMIGGCDKSETEEFEAYLKDEKRKNDLAVEKLKSENSTKSLKN